jgi:3-deoxy-D-manno-octulosonic acid kinase
MRHLNPRRYFIGHRAFHELRVTERARAAGVRVPEVVAAMEKRAMIGYKAALATVLVPDAVELAGWLLARPPHGEVAAVLREAGRQMGMMHAAGIAHPDLNLRNFLVAGSEVHVIPRSQATRDLQPRGTTLAVYIIDLDRARAYDGPVPPLRRRRDLARLMRSIRKIDPPLPSDAMLALRAGYGEAWPSGVPSL